MLDETSRFITWGLRHPEDVIEIPTRPAEEGAFPQRMGRWFWGIVLSDRPTVNVMRWRDRLRMRNMWNKIKRR